MAAQRTALKNEVMNLAVTASVRMTAPRCHSERYFSGGRAADSAEK
jgi:hypothetical protein